MDRSSYNSSLLWGGYSEQSARTPDFTEKVRLGIPLPVNPYEWYRFDGYCKPGVGSGGSYVYTNIPVTIRDAFTYGSFHNGQTQSNRVYCPHKATLEAEVLNRLYDKLRDQDVDLGTSLGEYRETANFVASSMTSMAKAVRRARRGDFSGAIRAITGSNKRSTSKDVVDAAANTHLALTYAIRPLLSSVYDATIALAKRDRGFIEVATIRAQKRESCYGRSASKSVPSWYIDLGFTTEVSGKISFKVVNPFLRVLDNVGLINPLSVAWELTPLSFVFDWFLPIGKFIQGVVPPQGIDFVEGYVYSKTRGVVTHVKDVRHLPGGYLTSAHQTELWKHRKVLSAFPRYHLVVPDLSLSKSQVASGLALLWQAARR